MAKYTMKSPMRTIVSNESRATWTFIHAANAQNLSYSLKVNEFADLSTCESVSPVRWVQAHQCGEWPGAFESS